MSTNAKTPDEIKKGLECCGVSCSCDECPYSFDLPFEDGIKGCIGGLEEDARDYIQQLETAIDRVYKSAKEVEAKTSEAIKEFRKSQQLEADNAQQARCIENLTDKLNATNDALAAKVELVEQYRWERDVAIGQLEQLGIGFGEKVNGKFPRWISVEERLPQDNENVLVCCIGNNEDSVVTMTSYTHNMYCYNIEGWRSPWQYFFDKYKITHWMPLPKPPECKENGGAE